MSTPNDHADSGDYTWEGPLYDNSVRCAVAYDTRTADQIHDQQINQLQKAVANLNSRLLVIEAIIKQWQGGK